MKKSGFIPMGKSNAFAAIIFFVVTILAFFPFVYNVKWNGLSMNVWVLCAITLLIPIYNIIADAVNNMNDK